MAKYDVKVTFDVEVEIDETKFTDEFMEAFRDVFYDFHEIEDHVMHLAQLKAREMIFDNQVEGYPKLDTFGVKIKINDCSQEII